MTIFRLVSAVLVSIVAASAMAAGSVRYKWRDAEGNLHYTERLPSVAGVRVYEVINAQGILAKGVEQAKTPE